MVFLRPPRIWAVFSLMVFPGGSIYRASWLISRFLAGAFSLYMGEPDRCAGLKGGGGYRGFVGRLGPGPPGQGLASLPTLGPYRFRLWAAGPFHGIFSFVELG